MPPIIGPVAMRVLVVGWVLDPGGYAQALERIYEANLVPATLAQRTTHPDLYDRMVQAGVTPRFPAPLPARKFPAVILALLTIVLVRD